MYTLFFLISVIMGVYYRLTDWNGISQTYNFIGLQNYGRHSSDHRVLNALKINFTYMFFFVVIVNSLAIILAFILNSDTLDMRRTYQTIFFFPTS